ncbi:partial hypothetical protein, partial [uncultured bacterium]
LDLLKAGARPEEIMAAKAAWEATQARLATLQAGYRKEDIAKAAALVAEATIYAELRNSIAARSRLLHKQNQVSLDVCQRDDAEYAAALSRVEAAKSELNRLQAGYLPSELEEARALASQAEQKLKTLQAGARQEEIKQAQAALDVARAEESAAQAQSASAAQRVTWCSIRAPVSGTILELFAQPGVVLSDGRYAICSIYDPGEMQVRVDVRQEQIASVVIGQACLIKVSARREEPYEGEVTRIDPLANLARDTVRVKIRVFNADSSLHKDMTATVDFLAAEADENEATETRLLLPRAAIVNRDKRDYVFVVRGGHAHMVEVKLGAPAQGGVVVESGINFGDLVAVSQAAQLEDGTPVHVEDAP